MNINAGFIVTLALLVFVAVTIAKGVRIVPQGYKHVVQRLVGRGEDLVDHETPFSAASPAPLTRPGRARPTTPSRWPAAS